MTVSENNSTTTGADAGDGEENTAEATQEAANGAESDDGDSANEEENFDAAIARRRLDKAQREAKQLRERLKSLEPIAAEAEKKRKQDQTEAQRLAEEKASLQVQLAELTTANIRRDAAEAAGLPSKFLKFITAADPEEALAQAKELAKELKPENKGPADLRQGARGAANAGNKQTNEDILRQMMARR